MVAPCNFNAPYLRLRDYAAAGFHASQCTCKIRRAASTSSTTYRRHAGGRLDRLPAAAAAAATAAKRLPPLPSLAKPNHCRGSRTVLERPSCLVVQQSGRMNYTLVEVVSVTTSVAVNGWPTGCKMQPTRPQLYTTHVAHVLHIAVGKRVLGVAPVSDDLQLQCETIFCFIGRPLQVTVHPMLRDRCPVCLSVTLVYLRGQTAAWIKMPVGNEVGLGPGDIVLDGAQFPLQKRGTAPKFRPMSIVAKNGRSSQLLLSSCNNVCRTVSKK